MSDSVRPHRLQPRRLPSPWDSPGKNTGVGCHFFLQCMKVKSESEDVHSYVAAAKSLQSCPTLCDPIDGSPPGFSVHGILQARVLEWGAIAFSVFFMLAILIRCVAVSHGVELGGFFFKFCQGSHLALGISFLEGF